MEEEANDLLTPSKECNLVPVKLVPSRDSVLFSIFNGSLRVSFGYRAIVLVRHDQCELPTMWRPRHVISAEAVMVFTVHIADGNEDRNRCLGR